MSSNSERERAPDWVGRAVPRKEDPALLTGQALFIDDLETVPGLQHAAILRSPHAHALIRTIDTHHAAALPGVAGILTGSDIRDLIRPIRSIIRVPIDYYPVAVEKVRYVGEPVAVVVAEDRYIAEDALDLIAIDYEPLTPVVSVERALEPGAPVLHEKMSTNLVSERSFRYGDPDSVFSTATYIVEVDYQYPRYSSTPIETCGVVAHHQNCPERYTVWSNFQGPFILHPLMAASLNVPGNRLRLITPPASGGSFGNKQAVFPYIVLLCAVSRALGVPVKWLEDRFEHLVGLTAASDRVGTVRGAFSRERELLALHYRTIANVGAYIRAPEPASLYRMHATANSCYRVKHIAIDNKLVVTNQTPTGLNRGYGGPQFFFAIERLMAKAATELDIDPCDLRFRNVIGKTEFPYACPSGSVLDSGDYTGLLQEARQLANYQKMVDDRAEARKQGRLFGIGVAMGVETAGSNMAYVTVVQPADQRAAIDPKSGASASASISMDPTGAVTVQLCSTPNGQGHATVASQIVADRLGLDPDNIDVVTQVDTMTSAWSITSGNYANRFSAAVTDAIVECADQVAAKLCRIAAQMLESSPGEIVLTGGKAQVCEQPGHCLPLQQVAANAHWNPASLPEAMTPGIFETTVYSPAGLAPADDQDRVRSSITYAGLCDLTALEIDADTGKINIHEYVSVHDVGNMLNPKIVEGQIHGGFVHGLGAAIFEQLDYDDDGNFLSGTFADYLCPTAKEVPRLKIGHLNSPSPVTRLGVKGLGDGCSMLTPVTIANAVADALGRDDIQLPLSPQRVWQLASAPHGDGSASSEESDLPDPVTGIRGSGEAVLPVSLDLAWQRLLDPACLERSLPGCQTIDQLSEHEYQAIINVAVAGIRDEYRVNIRILETCPPVMMRLVVQVSGGHGFGRGDIRVNLRETTSRETHLSYEHQSHVGGRIAAVGQRMLGTVSRLLIKQFFSRLIKMLAGSQEISEVSTVERLLNRWTKRKQ